MNSSWDLSSERFSSQDYKVFKKSKIAANLWTFWTVLIYLCMQVIRGYPYAKFDMERSNIKEDMGKNEILQKWP